MNSEEKEPHRPATNRPAGLLQNDGPNVTTLVRMCGNVFAFRWVCGRLMFRRLTRTDGKD